MLTAVKIQQLEFESENWKNTLKFMTEKNVRLKARLAELLQHKISQELLDETEDLQNEFIHQDDVVSVLRNAIAGFESMIKKQSFDASNLDTILVERDSISSRIEAARAKSDHLIDRFNRFALHHF